MSFKTRTKGTSKQIGQHFPVPYKNQLPVKIALNKPHRVPVETNSHSAKIIDYIAPRNGKDGFISANFDGEEISAKVKLIDANQNVAQWAATGNPTVFVDSGLPSKYVKSCSLHELIESTLSRELGIEFDKDKGHQISEQLEKQAWLQSGHTNKEWAKYSSICDNIHSGLVNVTPKNGFNAVYISPSEFLSQVPSQESSMISASNQRHFDRQTIDYLTNQIKSNKAQTPFVDFTRNSKGTWPLYNGRKTAEAYRRMGIQKILVMQRGTPKGGKDFESTKEDIQKLWDKLTLSEKRANWGQQFV